MENGESKTIEDKQWNYLGLVKDIENLFKSDIPDKYFYSSWDSFNGDYYTVIEGADFCKSEQFNHFFTPWLEHFGIEKFDISSMSNFSELGIVAENLIGLKFSEFGVEEFAQTLIEMMEEVAGHTIDDLKVSKTKTDFLGPNAGVYYQASTFANSIDEALEKFNTSLKKAGYPLLTSKNVVTRKTLPGDFDPCYEILVNGVIKGDPDVIFEELSKPRPTFPYVDSASKCEDLSRETTIYSKEYLAQGGKTTSDKEDLVKQDKEKD